MFGTFGTGTCECEPNANIFVKNWFSDCVYTPWDLAAFYIGLASVFFWIVAQLPQFISNIKHQSAEALSPWFRFQWLTGDSFNLLGCLLTGDQLATETLTATYFILADSVIISQFIYYSIQAKEKLVLEEEEKEAEDLVIKAVTDYQPPTQDDLLEFRRRLAKMTIVIPESGGDVRYKHDTGEPVQDQYGIHPLGNIHHHHPVTFVAGRSGAAMIAQAMQSPLSTELSPRAEYVKRFLPMPSEQEKGRSTFSNLGERMKPEAQTHSNVCLSREEWIRWLKRRIEISKFSGLPQLECHRLFLSATAMQRHMHSVVNRYGLDSGPPTASRVTIRHTSTVCKLELKRKKMRLGMKNSIRDSLLAIPLVRGVVIGAVCMASLIAVWTSTNSLENLRRSKSAGSLINSYRRMLVDRSSKIPGHGTTSVFGSSLWKTVGVLCGDNPRSPWVKSVGGWLGWGSSSFYLGSRFSQIALNTRRQSAEGLSLTMVCFAACANSCMGISILMRLQSWNDLVAKAPWILGSLGTVSLDIFIVLQAKYFERRNKQISAREQCDERVPLLP